MQPSPISIYIINAPGIHRHNKYNPTLKQKVIYFKIIMSDHIPTEIISVDVSTSDHILDFTSMINKALHKKLDDGEHISVVLNHSDDLSIITIEI